MLERYSGGYGGGGPPLSIPNREVKPACADGTADCGRVGGRHLKGSFFEWSFFYFIVLVLVLVTLLPKYNTCACKLKYNFFI